MEAIEGGGVVGGGTGMRRIVAATSATNGASAAGDFDFAGSGGLVCSGLGAHEGTGGCGEDSGG